MLVPITGWAAYLSGLAVGIDVLQQMKMQLLCSCMQFPLNFYALLAVAMVGLIRFRHPERLRSHGKAEKRAMEKARY